MVFIGDHAWVLTLATNELRPDGDQALFETFADTIEFADGPPNKTLISDIYAHRITYPPDWIATLAIEPWTGDASWTAAAADIISLPRSNPTPRFTLVARAVPDDMSDAAWIEAFVRLPEGASTSGCTFRGPGIVWTGTTAAAEWSPTVIHGLPAQVRALCGYVQAVLFLRWMGSRADARNGATSRRWGPPDVPHVRGRIQPGSMTQPDWQRRTMDVLPGRRDGSSHVAARATPRRPRPTTTRRWSATYDADAEPMTSIHRRFVRRVVRAAPVGRDRPRRCLRHGQVLRHRLLGRTQGRRRRSIGRHARPRRRRSSRPPSSSTSSLQELDLERTFDGVMCIDAMENVPPEDWPTVLANLHRALKPDGLLYLTVEEHDQADIDAANADAVARGLPVVPGEILFHGSDYHFVPTRRAGRRLGRRRGARGHRGGRQPRRGLQLLAPADALGDTLLSGAPAVRFTAACGVPDRWSRRTVRGRAR